MNTHTHNTTTAGHSVGSDRFSGDEQQEMRREFAVRLREAFDGASNAEIARRLKTTDSTIKYYMDGARLPVFEMLVQIGRTTGANLHWLLTGTGPRRVIKTGDMFSAEEEHEIRRLASRSGRSFDDQVRIMTIAAAELHRSVE